jgi:hypothetical protein
VPTATGVVGRYVRWLEFLGSDQQRPLKGHSCFGGGSNPRSSDGLVAVKDKPRKPAEFLQVKRENWVFGPLHTILSVQLMIDMFCVCECRVAFCLNLYEECLRRGDRQNPRLSPGTHL